MSNLKCSNDHFGLQTVFLELINNKICHISLASVRNIFHISFFYTAAKHVSLNVVFKNTQNTY